MSGSESPLRQDFEELETPRYLERLEPTDSDLLETEKTPTKIDLVTSMWSGKLGVIDKSLEELEAEDDLSRARLMKHTERKDQERTQLLLQQEVHILLIGLLLTTRKAVDLSIDIKTFPREPWEKLLKSALKSQGKIAKAEIKPGKLRKTLLKDHKKLWSWYETMCGEWTLRAGLSTGISITGQAEKESSSKQGLWEDAELLRFLAKELKVDSTLLQRKTNKKPKHRLSKHRKLKFDVHEKLLNFMAAERTEIDPRSEKVLNSLFGKKGEKTEEPMLLDIPLI